jgi:adenylate cyclase class IV
VSGSQRAPSDELEVKARVEDPAGLRAALVRAGAALEFQGDMIDRRFDCKGWLGERDEVLRLRTYRPADGARPHGVLAWKGPASARGGYRHRRELEARTSEPDAMVAILERMRFKESLRIDRRVEIWRIAGAVLRIEEYPRMDTLVEVEGPPPAIERAIAATGLPRERFLPESLPHFVAAYEARTGRAARLAR